VRARISSMSPRTLQIVAGVTVLVFAAALWFVLVAPKRSAAADAESKLADAQLRLSEAQAAANRPRGSGAPVSDVFRLAKAMPASTDQPGLVLEIARLADRTGVTLRSFTPETAAAAIGGPTLIPLTVSVGGSYAQITSFLRATRELVSVRRGKIHATGRLFTIQSVTLAESAAHGYPKLDASIVLNAYVYDGPIVPVEAPVDPLDEEEPSSGGASAAGSVD
jgi:Tfp pilus assembly protein PilO